MDLVIAQMDAPLDRDLYQADKGLKNTESASRHCSSAGPCSAVPCHAHQAIGVCCRWLSRLPWDHCSRIGCNQVCSEGWWRDHTGGDVRYAAHCLLLGYPMRGGGSQ